MKRGSAQRTSPEFSSSALSHLPFIHCIHWRGRGVARCSVSCRKIKVQLPNSWFGRRNQPKSDEPKRL
jgi:hypothetical protein